MATENYWCGRIWIKTTIHTMLSHEAYTGTVVWGANAKDGAPPVRVEDAHPAIVSKRDFQKARRLLGSRAPKKVNPRRASSPYLLSGIAKCETCGKAMTAAEAKSGKYTYYICHSLLKRGKGTCETPRLNAKNFEKIIVDEIRANILTESNIRDLVKLLDEEMDGVACGSDEPSGVTGPDRTASTPGSGGAPTATDVTAPPAASGSAETDREALVALYNATGGENWISTTTG